MPARNGTGPAGQGPRTGWGLGNCVPTSNQKLTNTSTGLLQTIRWGSRFLGSAVGFMCRRGRGFRNKRW